MAKLKTKIDLYLKDNSKTWKVEQDNIRLQNDKDGKGDYVHTWNVSGLAKPNDSKIAEYETAGNTAETLHDVLNKRAREYKELKEQLDLLYHDMVADKGDKTGEWFKHIKAVKDANPKE
jgi:hypothetical protein